MQQVLGFVELYLSPFLVALGLIFLFKGVVNYFVIGPSFEEGRREIGRKSLLWASFYFLLGLIVYGFFTWIYNLTTIIDTEAEVEVTEEQDLLRVPNVPNPR